MKEIVTPQSYRQKRLDEYKKTAEKINKYYEILWSIAKDFSEIDEPFRIDTIYGDISFHKKFTHQEPKS